MQVTLGWELASAGHHVHIWYTGCFTVLPGNKHDISTCWCNVILSVGVGPQFHHVWTVLGLIGSCGLKGLLVMCRHPFRLGMWWPWVGVLVCTVFQWLVCIKVKFNQRFPAMSSLFASIVSGFNVVAVWWTKIKNMRTQLLSSGRRRYSL